MKFGERLRELMYENNCSVNQLYKDLKLDYLPIIYTWLNNEYLPRLDNLIKIADYFCCSLDYVLGRTENFETVKSKNITLSFDKQLTKILDDKKISKYKLRKDKIMSAGLEYSIFRKHNNPNIENIIKIADYLGVSVDYLVGRI